VRYNFWRLTYDCKLYSRFVLLGFLLTLVVSTALRGAGACAGQLLPDRPNDILNIFVWKETELTRDVTVMPDGKSPTLIGEITAQGMTASELKKVSRTSSRALSPP